MTESSQNSETTSPPKLEEMKSELRQQGVDVERLSIVTAVGDIIVGEVQRWSEDGMVDLKNPRRLVRAQMMGPEGMTMKFQIIDWDLLVSGTISVHPQVFCSLKTTDEETQARYFTLYLGYLEGKKLSRAQAAGLHLPNGPLPTGGIPPGLVRGRG